MITLYTLEVFGSVVGIEGGLQILPLVYIMRESTVVVVLVFDSN